MLLYFSSGQTELVKTITHAVFIVYSVCLMSAHLQVLFDENFERVLVLQDHFNVHAEEVVTVLVLTAHVTEKKEKTQHVFLLCHN